MSLSCVALVDDEAPVRVALGRLLRLADYSVLAFASGEEFLDSLTRCVPDCVLLDVHMPGLTGLQVQARLREGGFALPVVFITASDDADVARGAVDAAAVRVLRKPFSNEHLLDAVRGALQCRSGVGYPSHSLTPESPPCPMPCGPGPPNA